MSDSIPDSWTVSSLAEMSSDISYGFTTSASQISGKPKLLRITDVQENKVDWEAVPFCEDEPPARSLLGSGDIVIARTGATTGKSYLISSVPEDTAFASYLIRVRSADGVLPGYLAMFMRTPDYWSQITTVSKGTAQPGANATVLGELKVPLPPLPEQRRIVAKLDRLSARSAAARDHLARTAKLAARAKQAILAAAFDRGQSSSAASVAALGDVARIRSGFAFQSNDYVADGIPLVRIGDIDGVDVRITDETKRLPASFSQGFNRFLLEAGDICVALSRATTGKMGIVRGENPALLNQRVAAMRCEDVVDRQYVGWFVSMISEEVLQAAYGGAQPNISPKWLANREVPWPDWAERKSLVHRIEAAFARIDRLTAEAARAAHLLDRLDERLLARAFRGDLVPQDPADEPTEALLARIRAKRTEGSRPRRGRRSTAAAS